MNTPDHFEALYPPRSRYHEIQKIVSFVKEGNSCQVVSFPGVGRSNVLGFLSFNKAIRTLHLGEAENTFHFVTVNFSEVRRKPLLEITKFLFLELVETLQERGFNELYEKTYGFFKESLATGDELVLFNGLKKTVDFLAVEKGLTIVFLFDRFEEYIPTITPEFFTNLRILRNRAKYHFSIVFSLNRPLEDALEPAIFADFHEFLAGHTVYLPVLDVPGLEFRLSYVQETTGKKFAEEAITNITEVTGGHGKLARIAAEELINEDLLTDMPEKELLDFLLSKKTVMGALFEIWNALTPAEQTHFTKRLFSEEVRDEHLDFLEQVDLVRGGSITIPLFERFVDMQKPPLESLEKERIVYDPATKSITKGSNNLSEKLTSSEFRLLRYMIENTDKVVDREELINAVWRDKSTAGVTDQALDQLVFRVRKKIEEDPNNPSHLLTVKGRGFKFSL